MKVLTTTIICLLLSGCVYHGAIHREYANGELVRQDEIGQLQFLYFSDRKNIAVELDGIASLDVGKSTQYPDPNSVKAVTEGVVEALIGGGL